MINFYRVTDLDKTREFYEELLGFKLYKDQGKCLIYDTVYGKIGFCSHFPQEESKSSCITFVYGSKSGVDDMYDKLKKYDGISSLTTNDYFKIYHFFVLDPNGLKLEFQYFLEN